MSLDKMMGLVINLEISILGDLLNLFINKYLLSSYCGPIPVGLCS